MSEQVSSKREWMLYLHDMVQYAQRAIHYTEEFNQTDFEASQLTYDAVVRNIELIGEAANRIPETIHKAYPQIPWRKVIATRNQLIHGYLGIDNDVLWSIIQDDLPSLLLELEKITNRP